MNDAANGGRAACPRADGDPGRQACLDPATRVLTADLRWVAIADLAPGQELVACDAHPRPGVGRSTGSRAMRTAIVAHVRRGTGPAYRIRLDDGRSVVCAAGQRWLSQKSEPVALWRSIGGAGRCHDGRDRLRAGDRVRAIALPWGAPDPQDGWFGGIIDGEGSLAYGRCDGARLRACQCDGPVLDRMVAHCIARRYPHAVVTSRPYPTRFGRRPVHVIDMRGMSGLFRGLGLSRPARFIGVHWWEGKQLPNHGWHTIAAIEPLGEMDLADIRTSTRTCVAEGFVAHDGCMDEGQAIRGHYGHYT